MKTTLSSMLSLLLALYLTACGGGKKQEAPKLDVSVTKVVQQDVEIESEFTGQTFGKADIQINPRVDGVVQSMNFKEGTPVNKGQVLYVIDRLPYETKVHKAEGDLARVKADMAKAKSDLDMIEPLAKINAVSQRELVAAKASYDAAKAQLQAAEASLENARIELGYCTITAPINGLIGISKVRVGDYVRPGPASVLNTISDMGDMRVRFTISEQEFLRIYRDVTSENSQLKGKGKKIVLKLSDGSLYAHTGEISFSDRGIDPSTGAMTLEAAFPNPEQLLRPGQYVKIYVVTDVRKNALLIPQRAVIEMQGISQVYVVGDSNKVALKIIETGPIYKDAYVVVDGLVANNEIAFGGTQLLRNGTMINPKLVDWKPSSPSDKK